MQAPRESPMGTCLGVTDRGTLWRAAVGTGQERIFRVIDQGLGDEQFKKAVTVLRERERPRMVPIVRHGYSGDSYVLEYAVGAGYQTLEERMAAAPDWRARLQLFQQVCEVLPQWSEGSTEPLGLTARDVVLRRAGDQWHPWLLPCPPVHTPSPRELLDVDRHILTTVPPEVIRGFHVDAQGQDAYALGTLAAQAAGCVPRESGTDDAVTDQARNALLRPSADTSAIPPFLQAGPTARRMFAAIDRHRHREPGVRPRDAAELREAVTCMTDASGLAAGLDDPAEAREVLCLLRPEEGLDFVSGALRAVDISVWLGELDRATELVDRIIADHPGERQAWRLRADVLWLRVEAAPDVGPHDPLVEQLLSALNAIKGDPHARAEPWRRAGLLHLRWGDVEAAADELYEVVAEREKADLPTLERYQDCWIEIERRRGHGGDAVWVNQEAHRRIDLMVRAGLLREEEGRWWHARFDRPWS